MLCSYKEEANQWPRKVFAISDSEAELDDVEDDSGKVAHAKEDDKEDEKSCKLFVSPVSENHFLAGQPKICP